MPLEQHPVPGEPVQVGGAHRRMAETGEAVAAPLIGRDEQYVHGGCYLCEGDRDFAACLQNPSISDYIPSSCSQRWNAHAVRHQSSN